MNWTDRCRLPPYRHQFVGVDRLVNDPPGLIPGVVFLFDEVGAGKTKQVIDAAQEAFARKQIDAVLVLAPSFARSVWAHPDPALGEIAKHAWDGFENTIHEYQSGSGRPSFSKTGLNWLVTNYELLRHGCRMVKKKGFVAGPHLSMLISGLSHRRIWLICDETWSLANHKSMQSRAVVEVRKYCTRATVLNGTPADESPMDLYSQAAILDKRILGYPNFFAFRAAHARMGGFQNKEIVGYVNLERVQQLMKPYVLRRMTRECVDLPPVLPMQTLLAPLTDKTWGHYKSMRDDFIAWLDEHSASVATQAGTKHLRMCQLTSGLLGGIRVDSLDGVLDSDPLTVAVSHEKQDVVMAWLEGNKPDKAVVWCRFRPELQAMMERLRATGRWDVHGLYGQQPEAERDAAKLALAPGGNPRPAIVVGNQHAGGAGINLSAAHVAIYLSQDFSLRARKQADGRIDRPGQQQPVQYVNVLATGPAGQKTMDSTVLKALEKKDDISTWTVAAWRAAVLEE